MRKAQIIIRFLSRKIII